jgi:hypothetical protein
MPDATPADAMSWSLTTHEPGLRSPESHLEQSFRKVFTERVTALGATVKETPGPQGNRLSIAFPGGTRQWTIEPQVQMGGCRPDFVLRSSQGNLPAVAIFTDGWLYHASPAHNRIADDARKRQDLRDNGVIVVGITAQDVACAESGSFEAPQWLREDVIAALMSSTVTFRPQNVEAIRRGPIDFLLSWIQSADVDGYRVLANRLPFLFAPTAKQFPMDATADLTREAALLLGDHNRVSPVGDAGSAAWWWNSGSVGMLTRTSGENLDRARIEVALLVDDRTEQLADKDQAANGWREWLRISNALNLREQPTIITALTDVITGAVAGHAKPQTVPDVNVGMMSNWKDSYDQAMDRERSFLEELMRLAVHAGEQQIPAPSVGYEADRGIPIDFAWLDTNIAVCLDLDADDRHVLELAGWRVFGDEPDAVFAALREAA